MAMKRMETVSIDRYVIDVLMRDLTAHDRHPSAFLLYLFLGARDGGARLSLTQLADGTGLSKRTIQDARRLLVRRRLLRVSRAGKTGVPHYMVLRPWAKLSEPG